MTSTRRSPSRRSLSLRRGGRSRRSTLWCSRATMPVPLWPVHGRWGASPPLHNRPYRVELRGGGRSSSRKARVAHAQSCDARAPSRRRADSEPMTTQRKNRRKKADRRSGADRRTEQAPPEVERRTGGQRRTGLEGQLAHGDSLAAHACSRLRGVVAPSGAPDAGVTLDTDQKQRSRGAEGTGAGTRAREGTPPYPRGGPPTPPAPPRETPPTPKPGP